VVFYFQTDDKLSCSFNSRWLQVVFYIQADDKLSCSFNIPIGFKRPKRGKEKKVRGGGAGVFLGALLLEILIGDRFAVCDENKQQQQQQPAGRSDSYDNGIKFGSPEPRSSGVANACFACLLYPLGTTASS